jgi:hypothetical protein
MDSVLAMAAEGPLRLTAFRGLTVDADEVVRVIEAAKAAGNEIGLLDLSDTRIS